MATYYTHQPFNSLSQNFNLLIVLYNNIFVFFHHFQSGNFYMSSSQMLTNHFDLLSSDVTILFSISDGSKDVSLKIILFNKNQMTQVPQEEQPASIKIPQMIVRMNKSSYGQFEAAVSLKAIVKGLYSNQKISGKKGNHEERKRM